MKWLILLTTSVKHFRQNIEDSDVKERTELYMNQINKWLINTNLDIYIVESSNNGHIFDDFKQQYPNRLHIVSFNQEELYPNWGNSSSLLEAASLNHVMDEIVQNNMSYSHIFKVTGRYFLPDIEEKLSEINMNDDSILIQKHYNDKIQWQNTEYYGMKKEMLYEFTKSIFGSLNLMEKNMYKFTKVKERIVFGPFPNTIPRGGDKMVIKQL